MCRTWGNGASEGIRTLDVHLGKVMLYQTELRSHPNWTEKLRDWGRIASPVFFGFWPHGDVIRRQTPGRDYALAVVCSARWDAGGDIAARCPYQPTRGRFKNLLERRAVSCLLLSINERF